MTVRVHFDGKVFVPDEPVNIPVGTPLHVIIPAKQQDSSNAEVWKRLDALADECTVEGPPDLAERHDHYAHGKPA